MKVYCPDDWVPAEPFFVDNCKGDQITQWGTCPRCQCVIKAMYRKSTSLNGKLIHGETFTIGRKEDPIYENTAEPHAGTCTQ